MSQKEIKQKNLTNIDYLLAPRLKANDLRNWLGIGRDAAYNIIDMIHKKYSDYYGTIENNYFFGKHSISPFHILEFLGWTKEEILQICENNKA